MRDIKIEKVVLNIGCGTKFRVEDAKTVLQKLSGKKPVITKSKRRSTFGVPQNKPIGCKVTVREDTIPLLERLMEAKEVLSENSFDNTGNFSFGIQEYINVPGMDYDPNMPLTGFDVCVALERPGYRVKKKRLPRKVGTKHLIKKNDAIEFVKKTFKITVTGDKE